MADEAMPVGQAGNSKKLKDMTGYVAEVMSVILQTSTGSIGATDVNTSTLTDYNLTLTNANTEYSQALPTSCRGFEFQCRTENEVRYASSTGKVAGPAAPYMTLKAGDYYYSPMINQSSSPSTLYFASATAGVVMEIRAWV